MKALAPPPERWLIPGIVLTALSAIVGYGLLPITGMTNMPSLIVVRLWLLLMLAVGAFFVLWSTLKLACKRERTPITALLADFSLSSATMAYSGCFLLGLNLAIFGMIKPQLGQVTPFTADPLLADIDFVLFGSDPWRLVSWFDHPGMTTLYHEGWFIWLAFVLMWVVTRDPSRRKDRALISYFLMWSVLGPLVHLALPAAGPVFFDELGLGERFAALEQPEISRATANYLWCGLVDREFNAGGGISAMPSLHLATMFWSNILLFRTRWFAISLLLTAYIFVGSVALGWHYAVDGIAGAVVAFVAYGAAAVRWPGRDWFAQSIGRVSA